MILPSHNASPAALAIPVLCLAFVGCSSADGASSNTTGGSAATYADGATAGTATAGGSGNRGGAVSQTCTTGESNCFSFFVTSRARLFALAEAFNGSTSGWGGDFRYGTGNGLTGADQICTEIAEASLPGNGKTWRAFLSTSTVDAIDRVGTGPWYDRLNRLIAGNPTELMEARPGGITDETILNDLPNEDGTPHHNEEAGCSSVNQCADNHDILTGSDTDGRLCTSSTCPGMGGGMPGGGGGTPVTDWTCSDWTSAVRTTGSQPRCGHTWPTGGGMGGGSDDWISILNEGGCLPGYNLQQTGGPDPNVGTVGSGGGYGAIYCLATSPY